MKHTLNKEFSNIQKMLFLAEKCENDMLLSQVKKYGIIIILWS